MNRRTNSLLFTLVILLFASTSSYAKYEDLDSMIVNFHELVSHGKPPADFTNPASNKYLRDASQITESEDRRTRRTKTQFYLMSNFEQDQLMSSGTVLYNDPVTNYVKKIGDNILAHNPELRKNVHFYVTKGAAVNAFAYDNGVVMVNIGLIAQLVNEAQLAFVLSHEATHFTKKHSIDRFFDTKDLLKGKNEYKGLTFDKRVLAYNRNSREHEEEADKQGFEEIYLKSPYSLDPLVGVFDVLQYSYLPFDLIKFNFKLLETEHSKFEERYYLDEINQIGEVIDEKDFEEHEEWSSHPNTSKRREYVNELVLANKDHKGKDFVQDEELFYKIRTLARFEVIRQQIIYGDYPKAIYNTYVELQEHPDNKFLEKAFASCLYGLSKYKTGKRTRDAVDNYKKIEGESQAVYYLFKNLSKKEACVLALRHCWKLRQKYPERLYYQEITDDLFKDLIGKHKLKLDDFSQEPPLTEEEQILKDSLEKIEMDSLSKYQKIKKKKKKDLENDFVRFGFVELFQTDSTFEEYYIEMQKEVREDKNYRDGDDFFGDAGDIFTKFGRSSYDGLQLGIDRLLIFQPTYSIQDMRESQIIKNGGTAKYLEAEKRGAKFKQYIKDNAKKIGLDVELIDCKEYAEDEKGNGFRKMMSMRDVINEQLNASVDMVKYTHEDAVSLSEEYGSEYVAIMGVYSARVPLNGAKLVGLTLLGGVPGVVYAINPKHETLLYMIVFNIQTGESQLAFIEAYGTKDREDLLNSKLYYLFYNIQREQLGY